MSPAHQLSKRALFLIGLSLMVLVAIVYGQVLGFDLVEYDDPAFLRDNPYVNGGFSLRGIGWAFFQGDNNHALRAGTENLWHPLTWLSQMLDFQCWGNHWGMHHAAALCLHAASVLLVWYLGFAVTKSHSAALFAALLFALHPLHAETVSWLSERKGVLSGFFSLLSLATYKHSTLTKDGRARARAASVCFLLLALMSKPSAVVIPVLLLLLDRFGKNSAQTGGFKDGCLEQLRDKWAWFLPAAIVVAVTLVTQLGGTQGAGHLGWLSRIFGMPASFFFYLSKLFLPMDLTMHYPRPIFWSAQAGGSILWVAFLLLPWGLWRARRSFRLGLFAWLWMFVCWLPISGLFYVGSSFAADRYTYLMFLGPYFAMAGAWAGWEKRHALSARWFGGVLIGVLAIISWKQVGVWRNTESLYTHAYAVQPDDAMVANNYATMLLSQGRGNDAIHAYELAATRFPTEALITFNQGVCLAKSSQWNEAAAAYKETLRREPNHHGASLNLGLLLSKNADLQDYAGEAEEHLERACVVSHWKNASSVLALIDFYIRAGHQDRALALVGKTIHLKTPNPQHAALFQKLRDQYHGRKR